MGKTNVIANNVDSNSNIRLILIDSLDGGTIIENAVASVIIVRSRSASSNIHIKHSWEVLKQSELLMTSDFEFRRSKGYELTLASTSMQPPTTVGNAMFCSELSKVWIIICTISRPIQTYPWMFKWRIRGGISNISFKEHLYLYKEYMKDINVETCMHEI